MRYRDAVKNGFFELINFKEEYKINTKTRMSQKSVLMYVVF